MPTYEYRCPGGHHFELFQKMTEEPRAQCPECGKVSERLLSGGAGFLFKGEGFYATDYRSESYKKAASRESGKDASPGTGGGEPASSPPASGGAASEGASASSAEASGGGSGSGTSTSSGSSPNTKDSD